MDEVIIIGHSLNKVDMPYFEKVLNSVSENTIWKTYYFEDADENRLKKFWMIWASKKKIDSC